MIEKTELWALAQETMQALMPFYWKEMRQAIADSEAADDWFALSLVRGSDPAPFSVDRCHALYPYTSRDRFADTLERLTQLELLERVGDGAYCLTDIGRGTIEGIFEAALEGLVGIDPLPAGEVERLNALLYRLVQATLEAPSPKEKWAITYSRWTDPGEDSSPAALIDQYLTDLLRYRDDAHIAAWAPYDVSGEAWEALTFVWRDQAHTAEELAERLEVRGISVERYQAALEDLAGRGWLVEESGAYQLTAEGRRIREEAEEATDRHFFVGWSALSEDELAQLQDLLARAKESLETTARQQVWDLVGQVGQSIYPATQDVVAPLVEEHGLNKPGWVFYLIMARSLDPEPVSPAHLLALQPYVHLDYLESVLSDMVEAELMVAQDGGHTFTGTGRARLKTVEQAFYTRLGELSVLPEEDLSGAESLLAKVVDACLEADEPTEKPCTSTFHHGHLEGDFGTLARIDQRLDDLRAFRDDAHIAAWKPYGVDGRVWETLTLIWREEAGSAEELAESLALRGYTKEDYAAALADLTERGWVEKTPDGYRVTEKGQALRQEAEETTDRLFYAPWGCLNSREVAELTVLLPRLRDGLQALIEDHEESG